MRNQDPNQLEDFFGLRPEPKEPKKPFSFRRLLSSRLGGTAHIRLLPKVLSIRERYIIFALILVILGSIVSLPFTIYKHFTVAAADYGGSFSEGLLGEPRHINPLLSQSSDADRDLVSLIFSGLLRYNEEGKLIPDLAKSYDISSDGLNYTVYLKENASWHDGQPVTADDIIFTIQTAQNPDYASLQRINWQGVEIEKANDKTIIFKLKNKYAQFLNNLTLEIIPKHIWQNVKPINFALSEYNLKPVGSGPYKFDKFKKDSLGRIRTYELDSYRNYYDGRPYINDIEIKFYDNEDELINAYNTNEIRNIAYISPQNFNKLKFKQRINIQKLKMPRYFGVFFNPSQGPILANKNVRLALAYATNKEEIIGKILDGNGLAVNSPLLDGILSANSDVKKYGHNPEEAKKVLAADGWGNPDVNGILKKRDQPLSIKITTSTWPELNAVANLLKEQWAAIGVEVTVEALPTPQLQQVIKDRSYQALLFGEILNIDPDPFSLWQ